MSLYHLTKHSMFSIKVGLGRMRDEELASIGVEAGIFH